MDIICSVRSGFLATYICLYAHCYGWYKKLDKVSFYTFVSTVFEKYVVVAQYSRTVFPYL